MAFVQTANSGNPGGGNSFHSRAATFGGLQTAHNLNAVVIAFGSSVSSTIANLIGTVNDTAGNLYVPSNTFQTCASGTNSLGQIIYHCPDIAAAAAGNVVTVTLTSSDQGAFFTVTALEESGLAVASAVDVFAGAKADGTAAPTTANSGSLTTTVANDTLLGAFSMFDGPSGTLALTAGFTSRANYYTQVSADRAAVAVGSYSISAAAGGTSGWIAQLVAFKPLVAAAVGKNQIMVAN